MSNLYKVEGHEDLVKDRKSGAVLLNNRSAADEYKMRKNLISNNVMMKEEINTIKTKLTEIDSLKSDMQDIKELLQRIANK